jgi:hypothetical protein
VFQQVHYSIFDRLTHETILRILWADEIIPSAFQKL